MERFVARRINNVINTAYVSKKTEDSFTSQVNPPSCIPGFEVR